MMRLAVITVLAGLLAAGCGAGTSRSGAPAHHRAAGPFAWLHPAPPPPGWRVARLAGETSMAYPAGWKRVHSDPGTVTAAQVDPNSGLILGYLNATPQQGEETLQNWSTFRPDHNREEGERDNRLLAAARGLKFRDGVGSCVIDRYRTARAPYQEIACLVRGTNASTVIVAAAPVTRWAQAAPMLQRAVSAFVA
jgi:hypothetical protein